MSAPVDVLKLAVARLPTGKWGEGQRALAAMAELIEASSRVIRAFEAYGKANGLVAEARCRQECEDAMVAQKECLTRVGGRP